MPRTYLVECYLPGVEEATVVAAVDRAENAGATCLELILVSADEIVLGLFEAESEDAVEEAVRRAGLSSERIVESVRVRPRRVMLAQTRRRRSHVGDPSRPSPS